MAIILVYLRACQGDFLWDDDAHIFANPTIVGPLGLKEIWTSGQANYFPLTMTSFWVVHALWGLSPLHYHVVTLLFHVAATLLLWRVLVRLSVPGAWLGAMCWALHPVQVESVAWICELKNTQSGVCYLLTIYFFVRWLGSAGTPKISRNYVLAVIAALAAILSKSSTVMLPAVLVLIGWWQGRREWRDIRWLAPFVVISLLASGWTIWEQKVNSMASGPDWDHGLAARFTVAGKVPWFYLGKLLWPHPLIFIYPRWGVTDLRWTDWLPLGATLAAVVVLWRNREGRAKPLFVALLVFGVSLFPVLGLFDVFFFKYSFVSDHFQYLASMGPLVLAGTAVVSVTNRLVEHRIPVLVGASIALVSALALLTLKQTEIYLNREALWTDTVARNPHAWIARMNLGSEYMTTGRPAAAIPHLVVAARLRPGDALAHANLGGALIQVGNHTEALVHLELATALMPTLAEAHNSLGLAYAAGGRTAEAIGQFQTALRLKPNYDAALVNLGDALVRTGRFGEAERSLADAVRREPRSGLLRRTFGAALSASGRTNEAIEQFRAALSLNENDFAALSALSELSLRQHQYPAALACANAALRLQPGSADCHFWAGDALTFSGRPGEAIAHYEQALRLRGDFVEARSHLGTALYQSGRAAEAIPHFVALVDAQPGVAAHRNNLGSAFLQTGRLSDAMQQYREALRLDPDYLEVRLNLALALERAGQKKAALEQYEEVLRRRPDDEVARKELNRLGTP